MRILNVNLRRGWGGRRVFAGAVTGVDDVAGGFPGGEEVVAVGGAGELEDEVVHFFDVGHGGGDAGFEFFALGGAVADHAARFVDEGGVGGERGAEGGEAGGGDAAAGGGGVGAGGGGEVFDGGGGGDEVLVAQAFDGGFAEIDLGELGEVAFFAEVDAEGAGEEEGGVFEGGLGVGFAIGGAGDGAGELGGEVDGGGVEGAEGGHVGGEIERGLGLPNGEVGRVVGEREAGADHVEAVLEGVVHG